MMGDTIDIGPIRLTPMTSSDAVSRIAASLDERAPALKIAFCNAHTAKLAIDDPAFADTLSKMLVLNDGIGIELAARLVRGRGFPENLNGTDFIPLLLDQLPRPQRIYLLGAQLDVVAKAARIFPERFPRHQIVGFRDGYFRENEVPAVLADVRAARADILLCAMGNPRQEDMIVRHGADLNCRVQIGVGALFDFLTGAVPRAPLALRKLRLEFLFRLSQEPRRLLRRYTIETGQFLIAIAKMRRAN